MQTSWDVLDVSGDIYYMVTPFWSHAMTYIPVNDGYSPHFISLAERIFSSCCSIIEVLLKG